MTASNYDDVLAQVIGAGLDVSHLEVGARANGKPWRCRLKGSDKEKRGWYLLHELRLSDGTPVLVGNYGWFEGSQTVSFRVELDKAKVKQQTAEEIAALRKRLAEDRAKAERIRKFEADRAADRATAAWAKYATTGDSDYLKKKGVGGHGVRYTSAGAVVVPMLSSNDQVRGLQIIRSHAQASAQGKLAKQFWPKGHEMGGTSFTIGCPAAGGVILVGEGYATLATVHEASSGLPAVVAWAANNLGKVVAQLRDRYPKARILICADDDDLASCPKCQARFQLAAAPEICPSCREPHKRRNAGVTSATATALAESCEWFVPCFPDQAARLQRWIDHADKQTDFNDLELDPAAGRHEVRRQIQQKLVALGWDRSTTPNRVETGGGGNDDGTLRPVGTLDELLSRYALVYGHGGTVFDHSERVLIPLSDMRDACLRRELHRVWADHPLRQIVRKEEVDFDPSCMDPKITCNLWAGWPTTPKSGDCTKLLDLLLYMCSSEGHEDDPARLALYKWMLCWLAYPIQNPGAKLKTTVVIHGPQGTGKNLFFEAIMAIYGRYGDVIDQSAIEDKFNDWASRKLFLIADEVVARADLYHIKNKLKAFITGTRIRINPKNIGAYTETNHVNLVFLSNESMPVVLEEDDRRYAVVWTPAKLEKDFYAKILKEIDDGGVAALHDYLLHLPLGDWHPGTSPPDTEAKRQLIDLSLDSTQRFYYELKSGEIGDCDLRPCLSVDLYSLYRTWCARTGARPAPMPKLLDALRRRHKAEKRRAIYITGLGGRVQGSLVMLGGVMCPPGENEPAWLGANVETFAKSVKDYAGAAVS